MTSNAQNSPNAPNTQFLKELSVNGGHKSYVIYEHRNKTIEVEPDEAYYHLKFRRNGILIKHLLTQLEREYNMYPITSKVFDDGWIEYEFRGGLNDKQDILLYVDFNENYYRLQFTSFTFDEWTIERFLNGVYDESNVMELIKQHVPPSDFSEDSLFLQELM